MLIISSLLLAISFLSQIAVLAAPIPLNGVSLNARASLNDDSALFSRTTAGESSKKPTGGQSSHSALPGAGASQPDNHHPQGDDSRSRSTPPPGDGTSFQPSHSRNGSPDPPTRGTPDPDDLDQVPSGAGRRKIGRKK